MLELLEAFLLGFLSSFTPCVFPLIPITLALFGADSSRTRKQSFILGLCYVLGMAFTYTILGFATARLGIIFGSFLGNKWAVAAICTFLFLVALFTLDYIQFRPLAALQTRASRIGGKGLGGAFAMGAVSGFVAAPCIGPALIVILSLAAKSQDALWGASLLFFYSMGLGTIFLALATFSDLLHKLPRAGNWLNYVKFLLAGLLFVVIFFLAAPFLKEVYKIAAVVTPYALIPAALLTAWLAYSKELSFFKFPGAVILGFACYQLVFAPQFNSQLEWINDYDKAVALSDQSGRPLLIDLYADWCTACKEFEQITFRDSRVKKKLTEFVLAKIDFTDTSSAVAVRLTERYEIVGLPSILIIKPASGAEEYPGSRITGFLGPSEFISHLDNYVK